MKVYYIKKNDFKSVTEFLTEKKIIFHPEISPAGYPDFSNYLGRKYLLIIDRNILIGLIELCTKGSIKDKNISKVIGSLMFWAEINNINITAGLALSEYAYHKGSDLEANKENNIFLQLVNYYSPEDWLHLVLGRTHEIPKLQLSGKVQDFVFNIENDHFKMHYATMLHIMWLYLQDGMQEHEKVIEFLRWNDENLLFCRYTVSYIVLLFSNRLKNFGIKNINNMEQLLHKCSNQAWDLTYLSFWSTLYWDEMSRDTTYLFATMDKELKKIFKNTHETKNHLFYRFFETQKAVMIKEVYAGIVRNRVKPKLNTELLDKLIETEKRRLLILVSNHGG